MAVRLILISGGVFWGSRRKLRRRSWSLFSCSIFFKGSHFPFVQGLGCSSWFLMPVERPVLLLLKFTEEKIRLWIPFMMVSGYGSVSIPDHMTFPKRPYPK